MKKYIYYVMCLALGLFFVPSLEAMPVAVEKKVETIDKNDKHPNKKFKKKALKRQKKRAAIKKRMEARFKKIKTKWKKRKQKKAAKKHKKKRRFFGGVTDEPKFQLGLILVVAAIIVAILDFIPGFALIASLAGLVGLIFIFWAIFEYY